ncbi:helix-turn-helix domain-containing protein [Paenibacillus arenilitoris]|uniref:Helix-turn-helix domain-containing protein n=1 Tax=Paenibacillus arenilitoris TaxID=2772299 RepID=A0A927H3F3_9BACL|nr:helix-turn-helix domain-containing protein [Paenibacillus arenilitoris]MBD2867271.1 helix-turn-helix domain-containing protein [Paenibacillus arenilitoris]
MPKYLYRLLVFSLLLSTVSVASIGLISYYIASRDIGEKVNDGNAQILLQNQMRIEQVLKNAEMGAVQYSSSSLVSDYLYDNLENDDFQVINSLSKGLYNLHSLEGVAETRLINLEHNWMISSIGFSKGDEPVDPELLGEFANQPRHLFWTAGADRLSGQDTIQLVIKLPMIASGSRHKALLIIDLSKESLLTTLTQSEQLGRIYVLNRAGEPFLSGSGTERVQPAIVRRLQAAADGTGGFEAAGMAVNYRASAYNGWTYASTVSLKAITSEMKKIAFITLNTCIVILLLLACAAFYGTRRMYRPIRKLFNMTKPLGGESAGTTKRDEFALIEERFSSLFSASNELQRQLKAQRGQVKDFFLMKLLMGQVSESEFAYKYETYGFGERGKALGVLALQIDSLEDTRYNDSEKELLLFAINNVVGELIPRESMLGHLLLDQSQVTLLLGQSEDPDELKNYFYRMAELIESKVKELLQLKISIGISRPFHKYTDAMDAYSEALEALKRRISLGFQLILHYEDIGTAGRSSVQPAASWQHFEDCMLEGLKTGESASTYDYFNQYTTAILQKNVSFNDFQMLMLQLVSKIYQLVQQQGGTLDGLVGSKSVTMRFMKLHTAEEIKAWFKTQLLPPALAFLQSRIDSQYMNIAQSMVELIREQYDQDISLERCAEQFRFHPVYLSRVFKKETGMTFIDYLTNYRMNMAKLWLRDSNLKITEIAERLNYTHSTGFIRTFRKTEGMTPGQYREEHARAQ